MLFSVTYLNARQELVSIYGLGLLILYFSPYFGEHNTCSARRVSTTAW